MRKQTLSTILSLFSASALVLARRRPHRLKAQQPLPCAFHRQPSLRLRCSKRNRVGVRRNLLHAMQTYRPFRA